MRLQNWLKEWMYRSPARRRVVSANIAQFQTLEQRRFLTAEIPVEALQGTVVMNLDMQSYRNYENYCKYGVRPPLGGGFFFADATWTPPVMQAPDGDNPISDANSPESDGSDALFPLPDGVTIMPLPLWPDGYDPLGGFKDAIPPESDGSDELIHDPNEARMYTIMRGGCYQNGGIGDAIPTEMCLLEWKCSRSERALDVS